MQLRTNNPNNNIALNSDLQPKRCQLECDPVVVAPNSAFPRIVERTIHPL